MYVRYKSGRISNNRRVDYVYAITDTTLTEIKFESFTLIVKRVIINLLKI